MNILGQSVGRLFHFGYIATILSFAMVPRSFCEPATPQETGTAPTTKDGTNIFAGHAIFSLQPTGRSQVAEEPMPLWKAAQLVDIARIQQLLDA